MMNLVLIGVIVVLVRVIVKANKRYVELLKTHKEVVDKYAETLKTNVKVQKQSLEVTRKNRELNKEVNKFRARVEELTEELAEHDVIFKNLQEDNMCLAKAQKAYDDVCDMLFEDDITINKCGNNNSAFVTAVSANLCYDSISTNYYSHDDKEITISLFNDYNDEQHCFMYEYLNDKYGVSLDGSDIRTNTIFTVLHELGHYVDYSNKIEANEYDEYVELNWTQKLALADIEDIVESWRAYREVPTEAYADKFAIEFMIKHFPELV